MSIWTFATLAADVHPASPTSADGLDIDRCGPLAPLSMNGEQLGQATDSSPLCLREQEPSKSLDLLLPGTILRS